MVIGNNWVDVVTRTEEIKLSEKYLKMLEAGDLNTKELIVSALQLKWFRLNTLYKIKTKAGAKNAEQDDAELDKNEEKEILRVKFFKPNKAQRQRYINGFNRDLILKARQLGFTTFEMIDALDDCLFIPDFNAGCIAHRLPSAKDIFRNKIKFAYQRIPQTWKEMFKMIGFTLPVPVNDKGEGYIFSNGSSIHVDVNYRGDTLQRLHVSEFGKICAKSPEKAEEIVTGAFEAVPLSGQLTIESTAEGRNGYFFDYSQDAQSIAEDQLTELDFKFHFFPWYQEPDYTLKPSQIKRVIVTRDMRTYFNKMKLETKHDFTDGQIAWYIKKAKVLGDKMKREYPTTPEEAFEQSIEGSYYKNEIALVRAEGRLRRVPHNKDLPVYTFWDLGRNDTNAIWFMQQVGKESHFIDYYENNGENLHHYASEMKNKGYVYAECYLPHDADVTDYTREDNLTRAEVLESLGFKVIVVPRINDINEGIHMTRSSFSNCWFDSVKCDEGFKHLEAYRKEWNPKTQTYRDRPYHGPESNGADAFRQRAQGFTSIKVKRVRKRKVSAAAA